MKAKTGSYHVIDLPAARRDMPTFLDLIWWKHWIYGLLEVDVTFARQFIDEHKAQTGEALSFTGYLAFCLARAVDEHKSVQAYMKGSQRLMIFDDVDVGLPIERTIEGTRAPAGHIIRRANQKTYMEIHQEIRAAQMQPAPRSKGMPPWMRFCLSLPWPLSKLFGTLLQVANRRDPAITVAMGGTVGVTAVGMFGNGSGWGLVPFPQPLGLIVGGIARKPAVVDGRIEPREMLSLTVAFDHDIVDGAPAARFVRRLVELIESGYGLEEIEQVKYQFQYAGTPTSVGRNET